MTAVRLALYLPVSSSCCKMCSKKQEVVCLHIVCKKIKVIKANKRREVSFFFFHFSVCLLTSALTLCSPFIFMLKRREDKHTLRHTRAEQTWRSRRLCTSKHASMFSLTYLLRKGGMLLCIVTFTSLASRSTRAVWLKISQSSEWSAAVRQMWLTDAEHDMNFCQIIP